jgi:hypothetical protein
MGYNPAASNGITALTGDVSATGPGSAAATVNEVDGQLASVIATAVAEVNAAESSNVPGTIAIRDGSGNISANNFEGNVIGNVTGNVVGNVDGNLTGNASGHAAQDLALTGGTMVGPINMNSESITNLPAGVNPGDAANVSQLQSISILNALIFG